MHTYIADAGTEQFHGGWVSCVRWAHAQVGERRTRPIITIFHARPGTKYMRVVAEVTTEGFRRITNGRRTRIKKADKHG